MYFRLINTFYRQCIGGWHYPQRCWYGIMCQNMRYICHVSTLEVFEGKYLLDIQWLQRCIDIRFWKYSDTIRVKRLFWKDLKSGWANFPGNTHFFFQGFDAEIGTILSPNSEYYWWQLATVKIKEKERRWISIFTIISRLQKREKTLSARENILDTPSSSSLND